MEWKNLPERYDVVVWVMDKICSLFNKKKWFGDELKSLKQHDFT